VHDRLAVLLVWLVQRDCRYLAVVAHDLANVGIVEVVRNQVDEDLAGQVPSVVDLVGVGIGPDVALIDVHLHRLGRHVVGKFGQRVTDADGGA